MEHGDTPMNYTLGQAAKATGKGKSTISNAIKKGRISASKDDQGNYSIDAAELHRVYPRLEDIPSQPNNVTPQNDTGVSSHEIKALEKEVQMLREMLVKSEETLERERVNADKWQKQAEVLALTDQREKRGLLKKLFS